MFDPPPGEVPEPVDFSKLMGRPMYYDIDGNPLSSTEEWAALFERKHKDGYGRIGTTHYGDVWVSTVWLGLNHNWNPDGPILIFETMVFGAEEGSEWCDYEMRYATKEQAKAAHAEICSMVFKDVQPDELEWSMAAEVLGDA